MIYFAEKYFYITTIDNGKGKIKLYDFQKKILKAYDCPPDDKRSVIVLASRQCGKCFFSDTYLTIRHKKTGKIEKIKVEEFFERIKEQEY